VVHRQPWPCAKPSELKTFIHQEFNGLHLGTFVGLSNHHISKTTNFFFFTKLPTKQSSYSWCTDNLAMCKPLRTQNFRAPRFSRYSFADICRPFQPSHLKNHEFHFFKKLPRKQSSYAVVHRQLWPCAKPSEPKTFLHQQFHGLHFGEICKPFQPSHLKNHEFHYFTKLPTKPPMPSCTANLGHVQNPPNSKLSCTKNLMVFIWGHL